MSSTFSPNFLIKNFNIHTVEGASCINIGNNAPSGFESYKKHNQGFGSVSGDQNTIRGIKSLLNDKALIDMIDGTNGDDTPWIKDLIAAKMEEMDEEDADDIEDIEDLENNDLDDDVTDKLDDIFNDVDDVDDDDEEDEDEEDEEEDDDDDGFFDMSELNDFWK